MDLEPELSAHALVVVSERAIRREWITATLSSPERVESPGDGTTHFLKGIEGHGGRILRVVVNEATTPATVVTVFFDRRLKGRLP